MAFSMLRFACCATRIYKCGIYYNSLDFLGVGRSCIRITSSNARNIAVTNAFSDCKENNSSKLKKDSADEPEASHVWTVPNLLCGIRIAATPLLSYFIINHYQYNAIALLTVAGLTDLADGYIARNFKGQSSKLGTFLDPLADKVLIITLYSSMAFVEQIPVLLMGIIVSRDVLLLAAGLYIRYISIPTPRTLRKFLDSSSVHAKLQPTYLSKVNTVLQITIATISLYAPTAMWISDDVLSILWYTAGFSTILSGLSYIFSKNTFVILKNSKEASR